MARKTKEEAEQTRTQILESALDTFCELGYSKTTIDEIARRIGLTKGAVYWHFKNKAEIIAAIITETFERTNQAVAKEIPEIRSIQDLKNSLMLHATFIQKNQTYRKFMFFIMFQMEWSETFFNQVEHTIKYICDYSSQQTLKALQNAQKSGEISKKVDIAKITVIITSLWDGLLHTEIRSKEQSNNFPELVGCGFDLILNSIKI